eukprot:1136256-Pelagomonas_calceolata.AAC.4
MVNVVGAIYVTSTKVLSGSKRSRIEGAIVNIAGFKEPDVDESQHLPDLNVVLVPWMLEQPLGLNFVTRRAYLANTEETWKHWAHEYVAWVLCRRRPDYEIRDYEPSAVTEAFREGPTEINPSGEWMHLKLGGCSWLPFFAARSRAHTIYLDQRAGNHERSICYPAC